MQTAAALPLAATATTAAFAQAPKAPSGETAQSAAPKDLTRTLAHYIVTARYDDLPANVRKEGARTHPNWVGVAIGGSHHQTVDIAVSALGPFSGPQQASLLGRTERFDIMNAAFHQRRIEPHLRLRRHPPEDNHPSGWAGGLRDPRLL